MNNTASLGPVRQLGYVVEDLDRSVEAWTVKLGVGPWTIIRNITLQSVYLDVSSRPVIDIALSYLGDMQIELIQQRNDAASPYRPFIDRAQFGLHHTAFLSEKIQHDVQRLRHAGLNLVCDINMPAGGRYVYFASPVPGERTFIELLEATPMMKQMFEQGMAMSVSWDGAGKPMVLDFAAVSNGGKV